MSDTQGHPVTITDIDIPFWRLVIIFVKFILAAIPAYLILALIFGLIFVVVGGTLGGLGFLTSGSLG